MFRHNILITYRNFLRYKSSFLINLLGLSTGLACTLLIYLWVADELSVDKFDRNVLNTLGGYLARHLLFIIFIPVFNRC